jgi:AcrR family transcriptional regulator
MKNLTERQKKALETRKKLLTKSLELFGRHGFEHVSIEQITKACNVSKGTFYTHFSSKYDVILEKFKELDHFYMTVEKKIDSRLPASKKILKIYEEQMVYLTTIVGKDVMRTVYTAAITNHAGQDHYLISPQRKIFQILNEYIVEGIRTKEFRQDIAPDEMQAVIQRCMRANVYDWLIHDKSFDLVKEMNRFTAVVLAGLQQQK